MPIYEYQCQSCGNRSEAMQRMSEPPLETCEDCGGDLKKLISASAFQFKGSGWYVTDYAGKGGNTKDKGKEASSGDSKDKDSKKSDSSDSSSSSSGGDSSSDSSKSTGKTKAERIASSSSSTS